MINYIQMADAMVDATQVYGKQVDAKQYTLKRHNLTPEEEDIIKDNVVLDWNERMGGKFFYYKSEDTFVIKVKSLRTYDTPTYRINGAEMIKLLKEEVKENDQLKVKQI